MTYSVHPISHRYQIIAHDWSNFCCRVGVPLFNALFSVMSENVAINHIMPKTKYFKLHICRRQYGSIFNWPPMLPKSMN